MSIFNIFKKNKRNARIELTRNSEKQYFENFNLNDLKDYYQSQVSINEKKIKIDLNLDLQSKINQSEKEYINTFIDNLSSLNRDNKSLLRGELKTNESIVSEYLQFYLEELDESELSQILGNKDITKSSLLNELYLQRVGIYPKLTHYATFDYTINIDNEPCNQLLVVNLNQDGSLNHITWES